MTAAESTDDAPSQPGASRIPCQRFPRTEPPQHTDVVAVEEPLEIRLDDQAFATIMRTPGDDRDLTLGFLFAEGIIDSVADVGTLTFCARDSDADLANVVNLRPAQGKQLEIPERRRHGPSVSSCGVCGKRSIDDVLALPPPPAAPPRESPPPESQNRASAESPLAWLTPDALAGLPDRLRAPQRLFALTGAIHAAALFDSAERFHWIREDIGRHSAVDKAIGAALLDGAAPLDRFVLQVSGRVSFEIVQKAHRAGIPVISAVSGVSSLAVDLAAECKITLAGFVRDGRCNLYVDAGHVVQPER